MQVLTVMINFRRLRRSPNTPPHGVTSSMGSVTMPPTVTTCTAELAEPAERSRTSHPIESSWNHWALLAKKLAVQSIR